MLRSRKQNRKLGKAFELANRIAKKEMSFKEALQVWAGKNTQNLSTPGKRGSSEDSSENSEQTDTSKEPESKKNASKRLEKVDKSRSRTGKKERKSASSRQDRESGDDGSSEDHESIKESMLKGSKPSPHTTKVKKQITNGNKDNLIGGKKEPIEAKVRTTKPSIEKNKRTEKESNRRRRKPDVVREISQTNSSGYSSESEIPDSSPKGKKLKPSQIKEVALEKTSSTIGKTKRMVKDFSVTSIRDSETKNPKPNSKSNLFIEPINYPTLSVLEETPREMTPIKSPRVDLTKSDLKLKDKKRTTEKTTSELPDSGQKARLKAKKDPRQEEIKKSLRKSSGATKDRKVSQLDSENSSYDTDAVEQIYDKIVSIDQVKAGLQLKDIIPMRDAGGSTSIIVGSSSPGLPKDDYQKKEFLLDESNQAPFEGSEQLEGSMLLLSPAQRNHILETDAELEKCMKDFQEVERLYHLHKFVPKNQIDLNHVFTKFLRVFSKAEIHRLPSDLLLSNNIGASIHTINQIVKKIGAIIPEEHQSVIVILDRSMNLLVKRLEDYVRIVYCSTLKAMICLKSTILDQNQRRRTSQRDHRSPWWKKERARASRRRMRPGKSRRCMYL